MPVQSQGGGGPPRPDGTGRYDPGLAIRSALPGLPPLLIARPAQLGTVCAAMAKCLPQHRFPGLLPKITGKA